MPLQLLVLGSVAAASKLFMQGLSRTTIEGQAALTAAQVSALHTVDICSAASHSTLSGCQLNGHVSVPGCLALKPSHTVA